MALIFITSNCLFLAFDFDPIKMIIHLSIINSVFIDIVYITLSQIFQYELSKGEFISMINDSSLHYFSTPLLPHKSVTSVYNIL